MHQKQCAECYRFNPARPDFGYKNVVWLGESYKVCLQLTEGHIMASGYSPTAT